MPSVSESNTGTSLGGHEHDAELDGVRDPSMDEPDSGVIVPSIADNTGGSPVTSASELQHQDMTSEASERVWWDVYAPSQYFGSGDSLVSIGSTEGTHGPGLTTAAGKSLTRIPRRGGAYTCYCRPC